MSVQRLVTEADIVAALPAAFAGETRLPLAELIAALREGGLRLPRSAAQAEDLILEAIEPVMDRFAFDETAAAFIDVRALLAGVTLTHRLDEDEVRKDVVYLEADAPGFALDVLSVEGLLLPDGVAVESSGMDGIFPLHGSPATLGLAGGDLIGVRFEAGAPRLVAVDEPADAAELVAWLRTVLPQDDTRMLDDVFDDAMLHTQAFRQTLPPLTEVIRDNGFGLSGLRVAATPASIVESEADDLADTYELTEDQSLAAAMLLGAADVLQGNPTAVVDERVLVGLARAVADPWLACIAAEEQAGRREGLLRLVEQLRNDRTVSAVRQTRAGCCYIAGRILELEGDPIGAQEEFEKALSLDARNTYVLLRLAGIAADRGQLQTAQRLLEQAGANPEYALCGTVESLLELPRDDAPVLGRNESCWCGSGRKYKVCHGRPGSAVQPVNVDAVLGLSLTWIMLEEPFRLSILYEGMKIRGGQAAMEVLAHVAADVLLFEGGGLEDYLRRRGPLLSPETSLLIQQWLLRNRSLFEVEEVRRGQGLRLRDLLTGDRIEVTDRAASQELQAGALVLARIANVGQHEAMYALLTIPHGYRDSLLDLLASEPTPFVLLDWLAGLWAAPTMVTPEGDLLQRVEGVFTTTSPAKLRRALDEHLESDGTDAWMLTEPLGDGTRILGTARLAGKTLVVQTTSEARYELMMQVLDDIDVPLTEKEYSVDAPGTGPADAEPYDPAENPEVAEHLAAYIREYERTWLDESIPALGGATPRQAADDPTRRDDLIRLLESFGSDGSPLQMDGARLRAALGL